VIGSGIAAAQLSDDTGLQLLENAAATAAGLFAIILMFSPVSGGHFNPVVSLVDAAFGGLSSRVALAYIPAQVAGCIAGAIASVPSFVVAQLVGGVLAFVVVRTLYPDITPEEAAEVVLPHEHGAAADMLESVV
jgi:glycerol uptake facilitator-like aquaporin